MELPVGLLLRIVGATVNRRVYVKETYLKGVSTSIAFPCLPCLAEVGQPSLTSEDVPCYYFYRAIRYVYIENNHFVRHAKNRSIFYNHVNSGLKLQF